ncbi:putative uncharacterized protein [Waddlia chondrophila 2032/99]|uniref:Uncharacterized protein n=2 Tax=Waddlia chondrophila TaxID=71667 RepID=D6YT04_WADCW|nr:hypothetical protein [Waddlia chondrophila]ADI39199.1 conserved hypothetical protein [Waddlia chondrophila WSU 86-1044]CCB90659.1 putative uncharacterized protein [Waddlia chondrophila 2032/99]
MTPLHTLALFGEAEKGTFRKPHLLSSLPQVMESLGNPPPDSRGLFCAVQALLYDYDLIFFRVEEEGFSYQDYFSGLKILEKEDLFDDVLAVCLPGVGDSEIIDTVIPLCQYYQSIFITSESDLYDYLTSHQGESLLPDGRNC